MKRAKCLSINYQDGDYYTSQGERGSNYGKVSFKKGYKKVNQGGGWATNTKPSRLILNIIVDGKIYETLIDRYFKYNVGRLTEKRRNLIAMNMPEFVNVHEYNNSKGEIYYVVDEQCLFLWQQRAGL
ncbi:hypothetical protein [Paraclostridium sordellii]|uniref:hypothetical protein n=1 Tax=Paraclostridium sordellii TaxID=1505 RepID=UPI000540C670|nr:hypothetical protein [Paeniclostridium sordellii]CEK39978.1 hypothetical protein JGS6382_33061 [[Clostridium] sordellii] [Paeniclostridium sordellii]